MKHWVGFLLAGTLLVSAIGAQAKAVGTFADKTLNVAVFQGGYGREYWDAIAAEFEDDYPGVKVNLTVSPKIGDVIRPQVIAGNPPDFIYDLGDPLVDTLIKDKGLADLSEVFAGPAIDHKGALKDQILPGTLTGNTCAPYQDGRTFLAPYNYTPMGLVYNKTFFEKNGLAVPKTVDQFYALAPVAKKFHRALFAYQGIYPSYLEEIYVPAIHAAGGAKAVEAFFNYDPSFWTGDAAKKAFGVLGRIAALDNGLMKGTVALNHTQSETAMMEGHSLFIVNGIWMEGEMKDAPREPGFTFGFAGFPGFKAGDPLSCETKIETLMIPVKAKNIPLAKEFLRYLYTDKSVQLDAEKSGGVFPVTGAADRVRDKLTGPAYAFYKEAESMVQVTGQFGVLPKGSKLVIADEMDRLLTKVMSGLITVDQFCVRLEAIWTQAAREIKAANG